MPAHCGVRQACPSHTTVPLPSDVAVAPMAACRVRDLRAAADAPGPQWYSRSSCRRWSEVAVPLSYMVWRFVSWTCALSLVALMAMPVRTLLTSHARCWSVGSLPYLAYHLAVCASAIMLATPASAFDCSP